MDKRFIRVIMIGLFVFVLSACGKNSSPFDPIKSFQQAIQEKDAKGLFDTVVIDEDITWDVMAASKMIELLNEKEDYLQEIIVILLAQANYYESKGSAVNEYTSEYPGDRILDIGPFYLTQEKKLFNQTYAIKVRGYELSVKTKKDSVIDFYGKETKMKKRRENLGKFGPGLYVLSGKKRYKNYRAEESTDVYLIDIENFKKTIGLSLEDEEDSFAFKDDEIEAVKPEEIFLNNCASCHANDLSGGAGPELTDVSSRLSKDEILDIIINGSVGMPGSIVDNKEAESLAGWLSSHN